MIERTFGGLRRNRRLAKDFARLIETFIAMAVVGDDQIIAMHHGGQHVAYVGVQQMMPSFVPTFVLEVTCGSTALGSNAL